MAMDVPTPRKIQTEMVYMTIKIHVRIHQMGKLLMVTDVPTLRKTLTVMVLTTTKTHVQTLRWRDG